MSGRVLHKTRTPAGADPIRTWHKRFTQLPPWQDAALERLAFAKGVSVSEALRLCVSWSWRRLERMAPRQAGPLRRPDRRRARNRAGLAAPVLAGAHGTNGREDPETP